MTDTDECVNVLICHKCRQLKPADDEAMESDQRFICSDCKTTEG